MRAYRSIFCFVVGTYLLRNTRKYVYPKSENREEGYKYEKIIASENDKLERVGTEISESKSISGFSYRIESFYEHIQVFCLSKEEYEKDVYGNTPYDIMECSIEEVVVVFLKDKAKRVIFSEYHFDGVIPNGEYKEKKGKPSYAEKIDSIKSHIFKN